MNEVPLSDAEKRILDTVKDEFFPVFKKLKDTLVRIQACRLYFGTYSPSLPILEKEYFDVVSELFVVDRKLTTPDILFEGLPDVKQSVPAYFKFQSAIKQNLTDAANYIEIIDRTLDRKRQTIQNNRTFALAVIAIIITIIWR